MHITLGTLTLALMTGSAMIALWGVVRFPNAGPSSIAAAGANLGAAFVGGMIAVPLLITASTAFGVPGEFEIAFISVIPPIVYLFASIGWFIRSLQALLAPYV